MEWYQTHNTYGNHMFDSIPFILFQQLKLARPLIASTIMDATFNIIACVKTRY